MNSRNHSVHSTEYDYQAMVYTDPENGEQKVLTVHNTYTCSYCGYPVSWQYTPDMRLETTTTCSFSADTPAPTSTLEVTSGELIIANNLLDAFSVAEEYSPETSLNARRTRHNFYKEAEKAGLMYGLCYASAQVFFDPEKTIIHFVDGDIWDDGDEKPGTAAGVPFEWKHITTIWTDLWAYNAADAATYRKNCTIRNTEPRDHTVLSVPNGAYTLTRLLDPETPDDVDWEDGEYIILASLALNR